MHSTEFQFFMARLNPALWAIPSVVFAGISVLWFDLFGRTWWIFVGFQILLIASIKIKFIFSQRKYEGRMLLLIDIPRPVSIIYLLRLGLLPLTLIFLITMGSSGLLTILWRWNSETLFGWLFGMLIYGFWFFAFRVVSVFSTMYVVEDKGIWIYFGIDKVYIPFSKITDVQITRNVKMNLAKVIYAGQVYIPGVRNRDYIILRLNLDDSLTARWFPEIYITPTNNLEFFDMLQKKMDVKRP